MKKTYKLLIFILLTALSLNSCVSAPQNDRTQTLTEQNTISEPQTAAELWERIDDTMNALDSMEASVSSKITAYNEGYKITADISGTSAQSGIVSGDFYSYTSAKTKINIVDLQMKMENTVTEVFKDGKLYISNEGTDVNGKLCSPMTEEEYHEYNEDSDIMNYDIQECTSKEFSKNEDNTWSLNFSGYTNKVMHSLVSHFGMEDVFNAEMLDMEVSIEADEAFRALKFDCTFIFDTEEGDENVPQMTITSNYSKFNEFVPDPKAIDESEFQEIEDIRILGDISDKMNEIRNAKNASFELEIEQKITAMGETSQYSEKDIVEFGKKNGGFYYDITAMVGDASIKILYEKGVQTVTESGESTTAPQTSEEAEEFIWSLINSSNYNKDYVTNMISEGDGVYRIVCEKADSNAFAQVFLAMGARYDSGSQTFIVTVKNGKLEKIESEAKLSGYISYGNQHFGVSLELKTICTFASYTGTDDNNISI
ncbi:MAG: hypothetical protein E7665_01965 [Ruminococcaceae bacterium]|nr:hypothetical protein [Oscillospiraceae bacterium]